MLNNHFYIFRIISYLEGVSYIGLVFFAMPLKYLWEDTTLTKIIGMGHGVLFVLFCIYLYTYSKKFNIKKEVVKNYFLYSLSPLGFLLIESSLKMKGDKYV